MTPERWQRVKEIFDHAVEGEPALRSALIREACGSDSELRQEVESLLASDTETGSLLDGPSVALRMAVERPKQDVANVGPYEILRELGKGGMGTVYLAQRSKGFPKFVALKVLRPGSGSPDILHRFDQECWILASLNHPNIARFFDVGRTEEGVPYYVMEFIDGQPIDRHCDLQRLDVKARLALFQQVCDAVSCAHRSGIVHRDLKPSNILVTPEGVVKLLDFGIAKLIQPDPGGATIWLTDSGLRPMTPEYASPEQIQEEELTRATDVYSLGVVLYEMLTGRRPYRLRSRVFHEILRVVCEEQPTIPSVAAGFSPDAPGISPTTDSDTLARLRQTTPGDLRKQLSGDLDSIVMKALRKEPWQRYASAAQFREDIRRHLEGSPVEARSGRYYRWSKRLNQHRGWLVLAIALIAAVATGSIHVTWPAVWIGAAAIGMFAIWQVGENRELARRIASGPVWEILRVGLFVTLPVVFFVSMVGPSHIPEAIKHYNAGRLRAYKELARSAKGMGGAYGRPGVSQIHSKALIELHADPYWDWILGLSWYVPVGLLLVRWIGRSRWGGSLILDASPGHNRWLGTAVGGFLSFEALRYGEWLWLSVARRPIEAFLQLVTRLSMFDIPGEIPSVLLLIALWALSGRHEFRQSGLMTGTTFYRWPNIESHSWIETAGKKRAVLTLKLHGRHPLLPTPKIKVPQAKRPEVEAVMARFLSEWPAAPEK
jgi:serine/threonine protein kinase